ncbi:MAG: HAD-IIIC family phosphatase [Clostridiales bacterium]|nr:HAD-IIIC family phosphatase [Clostridiales bacterium]
MRELEYPFSKTLLRDKKRLRRQLLERDVPWLDVKIAILGGSTTDDIRAMLELFLLNEGIRPSFYESEYDRYYEDAVFPNDELSAFAPDVMIFFTSNRNVTSYPPMTATADEVSERLDGEYRKFEQMWEHVAQAYRCMVIQNNFEPPAYRILGNKDASDIHGRGNYLARLNMKFYGYAQNHANFYIHDLAYEAASYGLDEWSDPYYWHMYKYAMCVPAIPYVAFGLYRIVKSYYGRNKKALALDLDNTLWGGVVGDDGAENIEIGQETSVGQTYSEFQSYLKELGQIGVLLSIDSKNEMDAALSGLRRPDSVLREEDFACIRANWDPKDRNLAEIADGLHLLPESFVFVDDNPAEREIVRGQLPGVAVPELGQPEHYIRALDRSGFFEVTELSQDDMKRGEMYRENAMREGAKKAFSDYGDYLRSLDMKAEIREFQPMYFSRIAQLTNKSNQFNLTTKRYSQGEVEEAAHDASRITLYGKLGDKFGDNGVVSIVIGRQEGDELHMELWLMSCRVLKRDMECAMMDELVERCEERDIKRIVGYYYPTAKNGMVRDFYPRMGFEKCSEDQDGNSVWEFMVSHDYLKKNQVINVNEDLRAK